MPIELRTAEQMVAAALTAVRGSTTKATDLNPGSVLRSIIEAPIIEVERLGQYMLLALDQEALVRTAISIWEDRAPLSAINAFGAVTISADIAPLSSYTFAAGTLVRTPDGRHTYQTTTTALFPAGALVLDGVRVQAIVPGITENTGANTITQFVSQQAVPGQTGVTFEVTNPAALGTGKDAETDAERMQRFQSYLLGLHRGDGASLALGAKTAALYDANGLPTEQIAYAQAIDWSRGQARVFVATPSGVPSQALLDRCQEIIDGYVDANGQRVAGYKAAGVRADVLRALPTPVTLAYTVTLHSSVTLAEIQADIEASLTGTLATLDIGDPLRVELLDQAVMRIGGVLDARRYWPLYNRATVPGVLYRAGTILLTAEI